MADHGGAPYVMRGIELATSFVTGVDRTRAALKPTRISAVELPSALEQVLLGALRRPPCVIAFSGGRDSAGLLAAATQAARRHGLPQPVPATYRFPGMDDVDESVWQDEVVRHLGIEDWIRVEVDDELDLIGPAAEPLLRRFGPLWPPNSHFGALLAPHATGGTLVTGVGGDELLEPSPHPVWRLLASRRRPQRSQLRAVVAASMPGMLRSRCPWPHVEPLPWLRPEAARAYARARRAEASEQLWWGRGVVDAWWRSRARLAAVASIAAACGGTVTVAHPFMDPAFLSAAAGALWRGGFPSRAAAMDLLFGEALPASVRHRSDKAAFFAPFVNRHSRTFIRSWNGTGVDEDIVDVKSLRACWTERQVDARSYALLQSAWLAMQ